MHLFFVVILVRLCNFLSISRWKFRLLSQRMSVFVFFILLSNLTDLLLLNFCIFGQIDAIGSDMNIYFLTGKFVQKTINHINMKWIWILRNSTGCKIILFQTNFVLKFKARNDKPMPKCTMRTQFVCTNVFIIINQSIYVLIADFNLNVINWFASTCISIETDGVKVRSFDCTAHTNGSA